VRSNRDSATLTESGTRPFFHQSFRRVSSFHSRNYFHFRSITWVTYDVVWLFGFLMFLNKYTIESWFDYLNRSRYLAIFAPILSSGELPSQPKLFPLPVYHPSDVWRHFKINIFKQVYDRIVIRLPKPKLVPEYFCTSHVVGWAPLTAEFISTSGLSPEWRMTSFDY